MSGKQSDGVGQTLAFRIERASLASWPALEQTETDAWILRFADGYTKRANSVTPTRDDAEPTLELIAACETAYANRGLPCLFRIPSFLRLGTLDQMLAQRGYVDVNHTLVLCRLIGGSAPHRVLARQIESTSIARWLEAFALLRQLEPGLIDRQASIMERMDGPVCCALRRGPDGVPLGYALGVISDALLGVFGLYVAKDARRQGVGRALLDHLLFWGRETECDAAYLQVERDNRAARTLYENAGFSCLYAYRYRMQPMPQTKTDAASQVG